MLGRAVNLYFITKYKNISTRKPKYRRAVMRIKEFILYGLTKDRFAWIILNYVILSALDVNNKSCLQLWEGAGIAF